MNRQLAREKKHKYNEHGRYLISPLFSGGIYQIHKKISNTSINQRR